MTIIWIFSIKERKRKKKKERKVHSQQPNAAISSTSHLEYADRPRSLMSHVLLEVVHDDHATGATTKLRRVIMKEKKLTRTG